MSDGALLWHPAAAASGFLPYWLAGHLRKLMLCYGPPELLLTLYCSLPAGHEVEALGSEAQGPEEPR